MGDDLGIKREERAGLGVRWLQTLCCELATRCLLGGLHLLHTCWVTWSCSLTSLNSSFFMPLPKAVLRIKGDNVWRNSQSRSECIHFHELYKEARPHQSHTSRVSTRLGPSRSQTGTAPRVVAVSSNGEPASLIAAPSWSPERP